MSQETYIQLFWFLLFITVFCSLLVAGGLAIHQIQRWEYRRLSKLEKAREAWAKMLGCNNE